MHPLACAHVARAWHTWGDTEQPAVDVQSPVSSQSCLASVTSHKAELSVLVDCAAKSRKLAFWGTPTMPSG